jgi:hypothetical protein
MAFHRNTHETKCREKDLLQIMVRRTPRNMGSSFQDQFGISLGLREGEKKSLQ